jgi:repressor LexA
MKEEIAARLKAARKDAGFSSVGEAATTLGVPYPTYAAHENGSRAFDNEAAAFYARRYRVSIDWLLTGKGERTSRPTTVPVMGYLGAGAEVEPEFEQVPPEGLDQIDIPFSLPDDLIAFVVKGDSMLPFYKDGTTIIVYRHQKRPIEAFYGEDAAVRTSDGRRFIKTIMRGDGGLINLISWNAQPIEGVRLDWIGEIFAVLPPSHLRRAARVGIQGQLRLKTA